MSTLSSLLPPLEQPRLEVGDPMPELDWINQRGEPVSLYTDTTGGRTTVLLICRATGSIAGQIAELRDSFDRFASSSVQLYVISTDAPEINQAAVDGMGLPFDVLSDPTLAAGRGFGLEQSAGGVMGGATIGGGTVGMGIMGGVASAGATRPWCAAVLNPNARILHVITPESGKSAAAGALAFLDVYPSPGKEEIIVSHAPVLVIPKVLEPDLCARLIEMHRTGDIYEGGLTNTEDGEYVIRRDVKTRQDIGVPDDAPEAQRIYANFRKRVFPEIFKAFRYRITRAETMRVGCYIAADGGKFGPHRDDNTPDTAHRRFGFTINLNQGDYEGGDLQFPEYGPQIYAPVTGDMVVFSVSLLHEVMPMTKGLRYGLFGFMFGEEEEARRKQRNPSFDTLNVDIPAGSHHVGRGTS
jgi:peroxiredoxin/predicted 2-oxoglutarate/Fe(II)-dependent dioxygenase YbiX